MRAIKKILAVAAALGIMLTSTGCGYRELYQRLLIQGIGIDRDRDGYVVTVRSSQTAGDEGQEYFQAKGSSVLEALGDLSRSTGREPFYSHNYLVVFGKSCGSEELKQCLDFFVRYYNTRPAVQLYMAENTAQEIMGAKREDKYLKMSELQQLGDSGSHNGRTVEVELLDFINAVKGEGLSPILPVLGMTDTGVQVEATAYFKEYELKGFLTPEETRAYLAVKDRLEKGEVVVVHDSLGQVTLSLSGEKGQVRVELDREGRPVFHISLEARADVSAVSDGSYRLSEESYIQIERQAAQDMCQNVSALLEKTVIEDNCDIFGFGNLIYRTYPDYWRANGDSWGELMAGCGYEVEASLQILRLQ